MSEININPIDFIVNDPTKRLVVIFGIETFVVDYEDSQGHCIAFLASADGKELSNSICGEFVLGHLIRMIDYDTYNGVVAIVKAYY